jgi:hypothetical protein
MNELANIETVIDKWRREGTKFLPPMTETEVVSRLGRLGRHISRDVIQLYCATGGMADGEMDSASMWLWPLARVVAENADAGGRLLYFADFLIDSHQYFLKYERADVSSVYVEDATGPRKVADSLDEFFRLYLSDPDKIGLWGES